MLARSSDGQREDTRKSEKTGMVGNSTKGEAYAVTTRATQEKKEMERARPHVLEEHDYKSSRVQVPMAEADREKTAFSTPNEQRSVSLDMW